MTTRRVWTRDPWYKPSLQQLLEYAEQGRANKQAKKSKSQKSAKHAEEDHYQRHFGSKAHKPWTDEIIDYRPRSATIKQPKRTCKVSHQRQ
jgi:hypothetical protein